MTAPRTRSCAPIHDAEADHGIIGRLIVAIDREASPAAALEMVGWARAHRRPEVIGLGIDYNEVDHPPEEFAQAYAAARNAGLKTHRARRGVRHALDQHSNRRRGAQGRSH